MDAAAVALAVTTPYWWPAGALLGLGLAARLARTVWQRSGNLPRSPWRLSHLARVAVLLVVADVALWCGIFDLLAGGSRRHAS